MRNRILFALALFSAFVTLASAQTTTTYTGTIKDLTGATVTSGRITWTLNAPSGGNIPGTGAFVSTTVSCSINASGAPVSSSDGVSACVITNNTSLTPTGTSYTLCIQPYNVTPGSCYTTFATGGTVNISTLVPTPATQPNYGVASLSGNNTWSGTNTFNGDLTAISVNSLVNAALFSGSDACAKINAAVASLPLGGGIIDARSFAAGDQVVSTTCQTAPNSAGATPIEIFFNPSTTFVPATASTDVLNLMPGTVVHGFSCKTTSVGSYTGSCIKLVNNVSSNQGLVTKVENFSLIGTAGHGKGLNLAPPAAQGVAGAVFKAGMINGFSVGIDLDATGGFINSNTFDSIYVTGATTCVNLGALDFLAHSVDGNQFSNGYCQYATGSTTGINGTYAFRNSFSNWPLWDYTPGTNNYYTLDSNSSDNLFTSNQPAMPSTFYGNRYIAGLNLNNYTAASTYTTCANPDFTFWFDPSGISLYGPSKVAICADTEVTITGNTIFGAGSGSSASQPRILATTGYDTATTPSYSWWNDSQAGLYHPSAGVLGFNAPTAFNFTGAPIQVGGNTVIPATTTGIHGNGAKLQYSDNTGTSGNLAKFDANGNVQDGGLAANRPPIVTNCGTTTTCSNTAWTSPRIIWGVVTLSAGAATVTGISPAFSTLISFSCVGTDYTSAAAVKISIASTSSITIAGTGTDQVTYQCVGN